MLFRRGIWRAVVWGFVLGGLLAVFTDIIVSTPSVPQPLAENIRIESIKILPSVPERETAKSVWPREEIIPAEKEREQPDEKIWPAKKEPLKAARNFPQLDTAAAKEVALLPNWDLAAAPKLNRETDNLNVLFVGVDGEQLEMVAVYSINNRENFNSGAVFFPVNTYFSGKTLTETFRQKGVGGVRAILQTEMEVDISYFVLMDKRILAEVDSFLKPIVVNGEEVDINNLFKMEVTPNDEEILGQLMTQLTKPSVYFLRLPKLLIAFNRYMETDFRPTLDNLRLHFEIASHIDTKQINKVIAGGQGRYLNGQKVWVVPDTVLKNVVYQITI
ncbi:hypothetical protein MFMK1_000636 [Metallumcola ferriviriculae]|uniref:Uncharacterized protein n=1 Tax=Metallumcola ferriviriculae TaxID=3039180 RepID=A0AAU0UIH0_9FIRM|nr:hypothetical protein MFMK1_000636 [Desulfitibacteraceae bacterium MK1]